MSKQDQIIEELKTEITGLKVRLQRLEDFLLDFPNAKDFITHARSEDEQFEEAVEIIKAYDRASASLLQRRLKVGYARAARLLDELEKAGYVGPGEGVKPREVLATKSNEK